MALVMSPDEAMVADAVRTLFAREAPLSRFRARRDAGQRSDPALWQVVAGQGFAMPHLPSESGGAGMSYLATGLVMEQAGQVLAQLPLAASAMAAEVLAGSHAAIAKDALSALTAGMSIGTIVIDETAHHNPDRLTMQASRVPGGYRLSGTKRFVLEGEAADTCVVACIGDNGLTLFLIPRGTTGLQVDPLRLMDGRDIADLTLDNVTVDERALIAAGPAAAAALSRALDVGRALLAAELLGIAQTCLDRTIGYLKERVQFGRPIGSFQALQHRAARLYTVLELTRAVVFKALRSLDETEAHPSDLIGLAKAMATGTAIDVTTEAIQMHGGIGVTDEFDIGLFFKRARVAGEALGNDQFHRQRLAQSYVRI